MKSLFLGFLILFFGAAITLADITGTQKIKDNIDRKLANLDIASMSQQEKDDMLADQFRLNLNMLVPVYGSYVLDTKLYGDVRPPALIFDWTLGGFIPLGLLLISTLGKEKMSTKQKNSLISTAVGLYLITRVGVYLTINEHIYQYNKYMKMRLNLEQVETKQVSMRTGIKLVF